MVHNYKFSERCIGNNDIGFTRIIRNSYDIGIFGKKSAGKTLYMSYLGYLNYKLFDSIVFSNYWVNFPHVFVDNIEDLNKIYDYPIEKRKVFLGDDFERWFNSRTSMQKINKELTEILLDWGKINCSLIYTVKRLFAIDISLRAGTCEYCFPQLEVKYSSDSVELNGIMSNYLDFLQLRVIRYDEDYNELPDLLVSNLVDIGRLYRTTEQVTKIKLIDSPLTA